MRGFFGGEPHENTLLYDVPDAHASAVFAAGQNNLNPALHPEQHQQQHPHLFPLSEDSGSLAGNRGGGSLAPEGVEESKRESPVIGINGNAGGGTAPLWRVLRLNNPEHWLTDWLPSAKANRIGRAEGGLLGLHFSLL